ncbi:lipase/esterase [Cypionkella aquatica]|uniref:Lipase/esterase n=1 Tax=Cypionkella aquatica TaxID=1756042 RepID=A0AA37TPC0_9RHOB|nr:alpha/beta hydrolase [Cypionkella aquatica]GLS85469.1 lipase/esterase [Cypionkella aquatica]
MPEPDYQILIDAATWQFIQKTEASYPADTASLTIADQRRIYDTMCAQFHRGYPPGVTAQGRSIAGVACRVYDGAGPSVVYVHGGGFVVGGLHSHDDVCADLCATTGLQVVAVDYRLSPEHQHPAAFADVCAVVRALPGPLVLAGDSAGGNLCAAAAHALRSSARILGQVLIYPGLGGDRSKGSYLTHAFAPMLTLADVEFYAGIRNGGAEVRGDPTLAPLQAIDFSGLPPTVAIAAECDPLADDAHAYATAIRAAGGKAAAFTAPGMVHGYLRARGSVPRAATSFTEICNAISALSKGDWPYGDFT